MNAWKLSYLTLFSVALATPACGGDSEGDDDGSGGSSAGSSSKGGSSSAGTSSGKGGSSNTGSGGKATAGTGNTTAGTGSSGDGGASGSGGTDGNPTECNPEDIAMDPMTGELPEQCNAYVECIETCYEPLTDCFEDGGACNSYVSCIDVCDCEQECVATNCATAFDTECIQCVLPASVCISGCQDEAAECM